VMDAALNKLGAGDGERTAGTTALLHRKLRDGGMALVPAAQVSPAAYLGSLAACHSEPVFATYCGGTPVPHMSSLHAWIDDSLQRVRRAAAADGYQADIETQLPYTAGTFFSHYKAADPSVTTKLQSTLTAKATEHIVKAAVESAKEMARRGSKWQWVHHKAITAKGAWGWKVVRPEGPHLRLSDVEYAIAARLNLGLNPFPAQAMTLLPEHCPQCLNKHTGQPVSLQSEPWHWLTL